MKQLSNRTARIGVPVSKNAMPPRETKDAGQVADTSQSSLVDHRWRPQMFSHVVSTGEQIEWLNASGGIAVAFSGIDKGPVHLAFEGGQSRTLCLWTTASRHGFKSTPKLSTDIFTLRFVTRGALIRHNLTRGSVLSRVDVGTFIDFEDMRDERASPSFSAVSATVSRATIIKARLALDGTEARVPERFTPVAEIKTTGLRSLRQTLITLNGWLRGSSQGLDLVAPMLEELVVYQFLSAWPTDGALKTSAAQPPTHAFKRALDYMEANLPNQMSMTEIAQVAGVNVRTLQLAFKRETGRSPMTYLIERRLDCVQEDLQAGRGPTIRAIAKRWGFIHMSDFSRRYRERFGHRPSSMLLER